MKDARRNSSLLIAVCAVLAVLMTKPLVADDTTTLQRERMVAEQIEGRGIRNPNVLRVMRIIPRHLFGFCCKHG